MPDPLGKRPTTCVDGEALAVLWIAAEHYLGQLAEFLSKPDEQPFEWREASFLHDALPYLTQEELAGIKRELLGLTARFLSRTFN